MAAPKSTISCGSSRCRKWRGPAPASLKGNSIGAPPIARAGTAEFKAQVLPQILSAKKISALAITEPSGGSDVANLRSSARRDNDVYVVNPPTGLSSDAAVVELSEVPSSIGDSCPECPPEA